MQLILYSKPGCHLCEGLQEKLEQIQGLNFALDVRDITTREDWFLAYQYEVPVLCRGVPIRKNPCLVLLLASPCSSWNECYRTIYR
jgi:hypothetical protein